MTLLIAAAGPEGMICATDRRSTSNLDTFNSPKVFNLTANWPEGMGHWFLLHSGDYERGNALIADVQHDCGMVHDLKDPAKILETVESALARSRSETTGLHEHQGPVPKNAFILAGYLDSTPVIRTYRPPHGLKGQWHPKYAAVGVDTIAKYLMRRLWHDEMTMAQLKLLAAFVLVETSMNNSDAVGGFAMQPILPDSSGRTVGSRELSELIARAQKGYMEVMPRLGPSTGTAH